jgi:hypothetical protein
MLYLFLGRAVERALGDDYPHLSHPGTTDWYYYVFAKHREK